jgi:hypothetical protein
MEVVLSGIWWLMRLGSSSAGPSGLVRVKLGDHFTKLLGNQKRGGERHERRNEAPLADQAFASRASPPKLPSLRMAGDQVMLLVSYISLHMIEIFLGQRIHELRALLFPRIASWSAGRSSLTRSFVGHFFEG